MVKMITTLVTCYYPVRSKYPTAQYLEWADRFLSLKASIVLFTTHAYASIFRALRRRHGDGPLYIVELPFEELDAWVKYKVQWQQTAALDPEPNHSPELYALWAQKAFFVQRAAALNPFGSDTFFWCDIGAFRTPVHPTVRESFPSAHHLPSDRVLFSSVGDLANGDWQPRPDGIRGDFLRVNRIVGGLWGGGRAGIDRWLAAYTRMLERYFAAGRFAGKDQSVMLSAYLEDPTLASIVKCTLTDIDIWFFLLHLCSDRTDVVYMHDPTYVPKAPSSEPKATGIVTTQLLGGLGNQMFQIAAAYAHSKCHGTALQLLKHKHKDDGRPMYWSSTLARCQPYLVDSLPSGLRAVFEKSPTVYGILPPPPEKGLFLHGYMQSPKYFSEYREEIRALYAPSEDVLARVKAKYADLLKDRDRVVVLSNRRTDYLKQVDYHGPLDVSYYARAARRLCEGLDDPVFLLCGDDPLYWLEAIPRVPELQTYPFVILCEEDDVHTLALVQQFRHFGIANSTFAWWGAWLAADAVRVVAPAQWFGPAGPKDYEDIYESTWIRC